MAGMLNQEDGRRPLFRKYCAQLKKEGIPQDEWTDLLVSIRLSANEDWLVLEGENSDALLSADSKVGKTFWNTLQTFDGLTLKALEIRFAKGKLGYDIFPSEKTTCQWTVIDETKIETSIGQTEGKKTTEGLGSITLESMTPVTSTSVSQKKTAAALKPPSKQPQEKDA